LPTVEFSIPVPEVLAPASVAEIEQALQGPAPAPRRLVIPSLNVDAPIAADVDFAATGVLYPPDDGTTVGRWAGGADLTAAAFEGTTLLVGHVQTRSQPEGALYHLADIQPQAAVLLTDNQGHLSTWVVTGVYTTPKSDPHADLYQPTGPRRLALVTCGGPGHASSVVVIAEPVPTEEGRVP
jgi:hypothetical protein